MLLVLVARLPACLSFSLYLLSLPPFISLFFPSFFLHHSLPMSCLHLHLHPLLLLPLPPPFFLLPSPVSIHPHLLSVFPSSYFLSPLLSFLLSSSFFFTYFTPFSCLFFCGGSRLYRYIFLVLVFSSVI